MLFRSLQKMNCFFAEKEDKDFKAYQKADIYSRNQRAIMTKLELPYIESSDELTEAAYKSKNRYWFGDDTSSLGPYWHGNVAASSSGQLLMKRLKATWCFTLVNTTPLQRRLASIGK